MALSQWLDQIHQGDCLDLMRQLPDGCVDLVFTSPPYNIRTSTGGGRRSWSGYEGHSDDMSHDDYVAWQRDCLWEMLRLIPDTGAIFYNHCHRVQNGIMQSPLDILHGMPYRQAIMWERDGGRNHNPGYFLPTHEVIYLIAKSKFVLTDRSAGTIWHIPREQDPWIPEIPCFPVPLPQRAIRATSARVVLDPFMGSGTTAEAALLEGRSYIGIDKSESYCQVARRRLDRPDFSNGTPSMPLPTPPDVNQSIIPARGSARAVFQYIHRAVADNALRPTLIDQSDIAQHLRVDLRTVRRAVQSLKSCGAIKAVKHQLGSYYELATPTPDCPNRRLPAPRTVLTNAESAPRTVLTDAESAPRTVLTDAESAPRTVLTNAESAPRTVLTDAGSPRAYRYTGVNSESLSSTERAGIPARETPRKAA